MFGVEEYCQSDLNNYCAKMIKNGHPFNQVVNFSRKYKDKKPFNH